MDDCIEREPLLKAFKEKCCQDCPGGYSHQQCHSWCDAASEIEMIENAPAVNNTPQQWQNSRLHPPTEADADRTGGIIVWAAASRHLDVTFWQNVVLYPQDLPFWMPAHEPSKSKEQKMNSILYIDDNGKAELYDDDYNITIFCKDEQEQQRAMKRLETANRMRWHDAKTDPPEDSRDVIVYRDGIGSVMGFFDHEIHKRWLDANTCAFLDDVTHWMEKPEDPEKTEEGDPE